MPFAKLARREKVFDDRRYRVPLDRNEKARVMMRARSYNARCRQPRQHGGPLTHATMQVLRALLWDFHNAVSGRCFPSYEKIAAAAGCVRSTVHRALKALEAAGLLTWVHRLKWDESDGQRRAVRTSNSYRFVVLPSESDNRPRLGIKAFKKELKKPDAPRPPVDNRVLDPNTEPGRSLQLLSRTIGHPLP